jgi:hypothetical protein
MATQRRILHHMSEMKARPAFHILWDVLAQSEIRAILAGGYAVCFHRFCRHTHDIDFVVSNEDAVRIDAAMTERGYSALVRNQTFVRYGPASGSSESLISFSWTTIRSRRWRVVR